MKARTGLIGIMVGITSACGVETENGAGPATTSVQAAALLAAPAAGVSAGAAFHKVQLFPGDYDGDQKADRAVWRPGSGTWFVLNSSGAARQDVTWGVDGDVPVTGDYDGDGITDRAVWRPSPTGAVWFVINSSGAPRNDVTWGVDGDIPVPGDYDGDGITDRAVWRPSTGTWFVINSSGAPRNDVTWGVAGDIPVPGDYDGDHITDRAVWRPSTGTWFVINSSGAPRNDVAWGVAGDIPVPGDYDGDLITDRAVWRRAPSGSTWMVLNSSGAPRQDVTWGLPGDIPVPGDYDGDNKTDRAVWRPTNGTWFVINSSNGSTNSTDFGIDGDIPLPNNPGATTVWRPLLNQPSFNADTALLLTDGTVMVHKIDDVVWWKLTPDAYGSYWDGSWSQLASAPSGYAPRFFASAVLPDGRVITEGGEYLAGNQVWTSQGAIYNPVTNVWTSVSPPSGWTHIGDAQSVVLANGTFMMADATTSNQALLNATTLTWTTTGTGKADGNDEEGWTLLPSGKVLTVDCANGTHAEIYTPSTGQWTSAGSTGVSLVGPGSEIGPGLLLADGRVFAAGATANTALYGTDGVWRTGPLFPSFNEGQMVMSDAPASLLPNGNALLATSVADVNGVHYLEFDGTSFAEVARTPNAPNTVGDFEYFLVLPTGEILNTDFSSNVQLYEPRAPATTPSFAPAISSVPSTVTRSHTYTISGTRFNGVSQGSAFGDDQQSATNYPLVRIKNNATGHVFYARTHGHSTMGVATGSTTVSTSFDVPASADTGASTVVVVANGVASAPVNITVN